MVLLRGRERELKLVILSGHLKEEQGALCLLDWLFRAWKKCSVSTMVSGSHYCQATPTGPKSPLKTLAHSVSQWSMQTYRISASNNWLEISVQPLDPSAYSNGFLSVAHLCSFQGTLGHWVGAPTPSNEVSLLFPNPGGQLTDRLSLSPGLTCLWASDSGPPPVYRSVSRTCSWGCPAGPPTCEQVRRENSVAERALKCSVLIGYGWGPNLLIFKCGEEL